MAPEVPAPSTAPDPMRCGPIDRTALDEEPNVFLVARPDAEREDPWPVDVVDPETSRARRCSEGCVLFGPDGAIAMTVVPDREESGFPTRIDVIRFDASGARTTSSVAIDGTMEALYGWLEDDLDPPWMGATSRALRGTSDWTLATDVATLRANVEFSFAAMPAVRRLSGPLEGSLLYAEMAADAVHLHLVARDCTTSRVVGSMPLLASACDGDGGAALCILPPGIEHVYVAADGTTGIALVDLVPAGHGGTYRHAVRLTLSGITPGTGMPPPELVASMEDPGRRPRWIGPYTWHDEMDRPFAGPEPIARGALTSRCDWECALFGHGTRVLVRPTVIEGDAPPRALVVTSGNHDQTVRVEGELDDETEVMPWHEATASAIGSLDGLTGARDLVRREAIANDGGWLVTPLVELGPPFAGDLLFLETTTDGYALRRRSDTALSSLGTAPLLRRGDTTARGGIARVYTSPDHGELVVLGYARTGEAQTTFFHLVAPLGP